MMDGMMGNMMMGGWLFMLLITVLVVLLIFWLIRTLMGRSSNKTSREPVSRETAE